MSSYLAYLAFLELSLGKCLRTSESDVIFPWRTFLEYDLVYYHTQFPLISAIFNEGGVKKNRKTDPIKKV